MYTLDYFMNNMIMLIAESSLELTMIHDIIIVLLIIDPFPPPGDITLSEIRPGPELRFNWTRKNCQMISYSITSDCGDCPTSTAINTAVCINVPVDDRVCSFAVRTVVCGDIDGTQSNSLSVTLKGMSFLILMQKSIAITCQINVTIQFLTLQFRLMLFLCILMRRTS